MKNTEATVVDYIPDNELPEKYECTLCGKTHRVSLQGRGHTSRYSLHFEWRPGGKYEIKR